MVATFDGRTGQVRFSSVEGRRIDALVGSDYSWLTDLEAQAVSPEEKFVPDTKSDTPIRYRLVASDGDDAIPVRYIHIDPTSTHRLSGTVDVRRYSIAEVFFESPHIDEAAGLSASVASWIEGLLSHVIDCYRYVSNDPYVYGARLQESPIALLQTTADYSIDDHIDASFGPPSVFIGWTTAPIQQAVSRARLTSDEVTRLVTCAAQPERIDLWARLLFEAREYAHRYRDYDAAIVSSVSAFETFLQHELVRACKVREVEVLTIDHRGTTKEYAEAIADGSLSRDLLRRFPEQIAGVNLRTADEYHAWRRCAYDVRNAIIHGGKRGSNDADSKAAFETCTAFMSYCRKKLAK